MPRRGSFVARDLPGKENPDGASPRGKTVFAKNTIYFFFSTRDKQREGSEYFTELFRAMRSEAARYHFELKSFSINNPLIFRNGLATIKKEAVAFLFEMNGNHRLLNLHSVPSVFLSADEALPGTNVLSPDNYRGGRQAAKYVHALGCEELIFVSGFPHDRIFLDLHFRDRFDGMLDYCADNGLPEPKRCRWNVRLPGGRGEIRRFLSELAAGKMKRRGMVIGSLCMYDEIKEFAGKEFGISNLAAHLPCVSFQDFLSSAKEKELTVFQLPVQTVARESIALIRRLLEPETARNNYRVLISMDVCPGKTRTIRFLSDNACFSEKS